MGKDKKKTNNIIFRVTEMQKESIKKAARRRGRTMSRYLLTLHAIADNAGVRSNANRK